MKNPNIDYHEYDTISIALKKEALDKMLEYYGAFGWQVYERNEDAKYFDIAHVRLVRKHKIKNKDALQYLQVRMEAVVNRFAAVRKNRHARSVSFGLTLSLAALGLIAGGFMLAALKGGALFVSLGVASCFAGLSIGALTVPVVRKTVRHEKTRFSSKFKEMGSEIVRIIGSAKKLYGENYEKN